MTDEYSNLYHEQSIIIPNENASLPAIPVYYINGKHAISFEAPQISVIIRQGIHLISQEDRNNIVAELTRDLERVTFRQTVKRHEGRIKELEDRLDALSRALARIIESNLEQRVEVLELCYTLKETGQ